MGKKKHVESGAFEGPSKITYKQYWDEVRGLAKEILKEADGDDERVSDLQHEMVDGHEWIIYTWAYPYVLIHSENEDALFEDMGEQQATSYSQIMQQMAFYALYTDVGNYIAKLQHEADE